jgi:hypothetical protein
VKVEDRLFTVIIFTFIVLWIFAEQVLKMNQNIQDEVKKMLEKFSPDERGFMEAVATDRIQNKMYEQQIAQLQEAHDQLWKVLITLLSAEEKKEIRIHKTKFLRFKGEYRIDRTFDEEKGELVLRLLAVTDEQK